MARVRVVPPEWVSKFVGIPFLDGGRRLEDGGLDCYGLCRAVLSERAGVEIAAFDMNVASCNKDRQASEIESLRGLGPWEMVSRGDELIFDVAEIATVYRSAIGFKVAGLHMGIVVGKGWMLHTQGDTGSLCQRYDRAPWDKRIDRFWRVAA